MGKSKEPIIEDLSLIEDFKEARGALEKAVLTSKSLTGRAITFLHIAQLYKAIVENTQNSDLRQSAAEEAQYFLTEAVRYKNQYEFQREILPEQFNADNSM